MKYLYLLALFTVFKIMSISLPNKLFDIDIYIQNEYTKNEGYGLDDFYNNGEYLIIKKLIKNYEIVFDVGANVGSWSREVLDFYPNVQLKCFEPGPEAHNILNNIFQRFNNVEVFNLGLGIADEEREFYVYPGIASGGTTLFERPVFSGFPHQKIKIKIVSLDSFCNLKKFNKIDFLKIDSEGSELFIIKGASSLIKNKKINFIQFEYGGTYRDAKITLKELYSLLNKNNYLVFRIFKKGLIHIPHWSEDLENYKYSNYLAVCQN